MKLFNIQAKLGWKYATVDEMQKSSADMIAQKHGLNAPPIYDAFNKANVYLPSVMHFFMGKDWQKNNNVLWELLMSDTNDCLFELIKNDYKKLNETIN